MSVKNMQHMPAYASFFIYKSHTLSNGDSLRFNRIIVLVHHDFNEKKRTEENLLKISVISHLTWAGFSLL